MRKIFIVSIFALIMTFLTACSADQTKQVVNEKVEQAKQEISDQVSESVQKAIDAQVEAITYSVESKLDPELGKIRTNMSNIKDTALVYFKINKKFPDLKAIQTFFKENFSDMEIKYELSENKLKVTIEYTGEKYDKEKVKDIIIDKSTNK